MGMLFGFILNLQNGGLFVLFFVSFSVFSSFVFDVGFFFGFSNINLNLMKDDFDSFLDEVVFDIVVFSIGVFVVGCNEVKCVVLIVVKMEGLFLFYLL